MKKMDGKILKPDEKFSNHAIQGYSSDRCPLEESRACSQIATWGGGALVKKCENFIEGGKDVSCAIM